MVPLREWLRPPKSLLLILVLLSLVSVSAVGWFGYKLLKQDRMVQAQRRQERLEQAVCCSQMVLSFRDLSNTTKA